MNDSINLDYCGRCGGPLNIVDGTDPEEAADTGVWEETYVCADCGHTGVYKVNGPAGTHEGTGVVV